MGAGYWQVRLFHESFGLDVAERPVFDPDPALVALRARLIQEEAKEVHEELATLIRQARSGRPQSDIVPTLQRAAKELADLYYVVQGTCISLGIDLDRAVQAVHLSNMSKLGEDGKPVRRPDGKVLKGPNYREPDYDDVLEAPLDVESELIEEVRPCGS